MDNKEIDRKKIMDFIATHGSEVSVEEIIAQSGADKLRVYPILFEEELVDRIEVLERARLGGAEKVRLK